MKIIAYGIRDDEKPYLDEWVTKNHIEVKAVPDLLDSSNIDLAKNYDGVVAYQQKPYTADLFDKMHEFGIHAFSLRNVGVDNVPADALKKMISKFRTYQHILQEQLLNCQSPNC